MSLKTLWTSAARWEHALTSLAARAGRPQGGWPSTELPQRADGGGEERAALRRNHRHREFAGGAPVSHQPAAHTAVEALSPPAAVLPQACAGVQPAEQPTDGII